MPHRSDLDAPILALDTASPTVSVAVGHGLDDGSGVLAERRLDLRRSAERLLDVVDEVLADTSLTLHDLRGVAVIRGPGSFTGLRVGLGTALGWHQALRLPVTGLDGHEVLAAAAAARWAAEDSEALDGRHIVAAVDALRGAWCVRTYSLDAAGVPTALDERRLATADELAADRVPVIGFGVDPIGHAEGADHLELLAAPPLAPHALAVAERATWDPGLLIEPIYFRPPAVSRSKKDPAPPPLPVEAPGRAG